MNLAIHYREPQHRAKVCEQEAGVETPSIVALDDGTTYISNNSTINSRTPGFDIRTGNIVAPRLASLKLKPTNFFSGLVPLFCRDLGFDNGFGATSSFNTPRW